MTDPTRILLNSVLLTIFGSFLTLLATRYWWHRNDAVRIAESLKNEAVKKAEVIKADHDKLAARVAELEGALNLVKAAVVPISTAFQAILIKELTHDAFPELDALLVKVGATNVQLTEFEEHRLTFLLVERSEDRRVPESERDAAKILPAVRKRVAIEVELPPDTPVEVQVVAVAPKEVMHDVAAAHQPPKTPPAVDQRAPTGGTTRRLGQPATTGTTAAAGNPAAETVEEEGKT